MMINIAKNIIGVAIGFGLSASPTLAETCKVWVETLPTSDSTQVKKEQFKKEYRGKIGFLESLIAQTRERIKTEKKDAREKHDKELDGLEEAKNNLSTKLDSSQEGTQADWQKFTDEIREEYDETESKVRNFFKK